MLFFPWKEGLHMINHYLKLTQIRDGESLYHYTKVSSLMNILKTRSLFATKSSFLNDTNEMDYIIHVTADVIRKLSNQAWIDLLMKHVVNTMEEYKRHDTFVLSLSTDKDSITLWSEFGEQTGYSVAFDGEKLIDEIDKAQEIYCHGCCIYSETLQDELVHNLITQQIPVKEGMSFPEIMNEAMHDEDCKVFQDYCHRLHKILNAYAMFFKQQEFEAEKEYRIVFRNPDKKKILFREKEGFLLPYIVIDLSDQKRLPLSRITVAPKNHTDLARKGMIQYLDSLGYDVPVELSRLKLRY